MRTLLGAVVGVLLAGHATAEQVGVYFSGNALHDVCTSTAPTDMNRCHGYIMGVADALAQVDDFIAYRSCIPMAVRSDQLRDVVKQWLVAHPETRQNTAPSNIAAAFQAAFPCPKR